MQDIRTIVVEDNQEQLDYICNLVSGSSQCELLKGFVDPIAAHAFIEKHQPDFMVLDHHMPGMKGLDLAIETQKISKDTVIAFMTQDAGLAEESTLLRNVVVFLSKPVFKHQFDRGVEKIAEYLTSQRRGGYENGSFLIMYYQNKFQMVEMIYKRDLMYIIADKNYCDFVTVNGKFTGRYQISDYNALLNHDEFLRPRRGCIVNAKYVKSFNRKQIIMRNNYEVNISRSGHGPVFKQDLEMLFNRWKRIM